MKSKLLNLPDELANDLEILVPKGQHTKWVINAIKAKMGEPRNVVWLAQNKLAMEQWSKEKLPPSEILPSDGAGNKVVALW